MTVLFFILGLIVLVAGGELLVRGASRLALAFGISPLVVGLTVVAFGTSSPELAVSVQSALSGQTDIALGNVVGSNIFNVLFILGASALITPLVVARQLVRQEVPLMIAVSLLLFGLALDGNISRGEAALLAVLLVVYTVFLIRQRRAAAQAEAAIGEAATGRGWKDHWLVQVALIGAGPVRRYIEFWVIALAIVGGCLLLFLVVILLWKVIFCSLDFLSFSLISVTISTQ